MGKAIICNLGKSRSFGRLSLKAKVLWPMLLVAADDQGRGDAAADAVKWYICPNVDEITQDDVPGLLAEMGEQGMVCVYEDGDSEPIFQIVKWWRYQNPQWAQESQYPAPEGWTDRIRKNVRGGEYQVESWEHPGGFAKPDPAADPGGKPGGKPRGQTREEKRREEKRREEKPLSSANADYQAIRKRWIELFPDKAQPRESNQTLTGKTKTRMKSADFRDNWEAALERAAQSSFLNQESWFYLDWFLKNDDNWHKCLIGKYDDKGRKPPPEKEPAKRTVTVENPDGSTEEVEVYA